MTPATVVAVETRTCSRCGRDLPVSQYLITSRGGLRAECKACTSAYKRAWVAEVRARADVAGSVFCRKCARSLPVEAFDLRPDGSRARTCSDCTRRQRELLSAEANRRPARPGRCPVCRVNRAAYTVVTLDGATIRACSPCERELARLRESHCRHA